jgi:predicted transcriptional regulator
MSVLQIRRELHEIIEVADDKWVAAVYAMLHSLMENDQTVIAFTATGQPLTRQDFVAQIRAAYAAGKQGQTMTAQEVLEEIKTW